MLDKTKFREQSISKSGLIPRPIFDQLEPGIRREAPSPVALHQNPQDEGATTGIIPIVTEGEDSSAERDDDRARC